jgi:hypothetical protein
VQESKSFNISINTKKTKLMVAGIHDSKVSITLDDEDIDKIGVQIPWISEGIKWRMHKRNLEQDYCG